MSFPVSTSPGQSRSGSVDRGRRNDEEGVDDAVETQAAVEELPTYDRAGPQIRKEGQGASIHEEKLAIKDVDFAEYVRKQIFKLKSPDEDNEIFLSKIRDRMERVGVEVPTVEVRYQDLKVTGQVYLGRRALPTLYNVTQNWIEGLFTSLGIIKTNMRDITILDGVSGILKPGRMTLLLGPPSSGKSTLLKALAGMLDENLKIEGEIAYNGHTFEEFVPQRTSAYVSQDDLHIPELTVRETMDYSARFQGTDDRYGILTEILQREQEQGIKPDPDVDLYMKATAMEDISHKLVTEYSMKIMGLDNCADTICGNEMIRGISGGQMKRLTTGEMIVGPSKALFMDEISTGLDATTTYKVVKCLSQKAHIESATILVSLLQPPPETYDLFDDIILISSGCIVYHGPLENVEEFFEYCGFKCPPRKHVADFLQEVTSFKNQEQYWIKRNEPYRFVPVNNFVDAFKNFHVGQRWLKEVAEPFDKSKTDKVALTRNKYALSHWDLFKINFEKELLSIKKNKGLYIFSILQMTVMTAIAASLFFRTLRHRRNLTDAGQYGGALFFLLNEVVLMGFSELVFITVRKPVFHKFRKMHFFPPWTWALSMLLTKIPFAFIEALFSLIPCYYVVGFAPSVWRFIRLWLLLACATIMSSGLFRAAGALFMTPVVAHSTGGLIIMMLFTLSGYILPRTHMKKWLVWAYWALPLSYAQSGIVVNEYLAHQWKRFTPDHPEHTLGHRYIRSLGLFPRGYWYWIAVGAMLAYAFAFYIAYAVILTYVRAPEKNKAVISDELLAERHRDKIGADIEQSTRVQSLPRSLSRSLRSGTPSTERVSLTLGGTDDLDQQERLSKSGSAIQRAYSSQSSDFETVKLPSRKIIMPFQPLAISFSEINYYVDIPQAAKEAGIVGNKLQLLKRITGVFRPGVLTALVGVTGAGKSTLMDVLSGRKTRGIIEGDIRINGYPKNQESFARIAGYCEQNDIHTAQLTIDESLIFSAWLRLPADLPAEIKLEFIAEVMDLVELTSLRDALVGVPGESGLSTEQRKRLTIAVELVANPSIIFMDEPTSGLDSRAAATVMRTVRNTVDTGRTVVCTIHQPSIDIFESFDELLLLKRGGETVYAGPLGRDSRHLIEYFQKFEGVPKIKDGANPAAWMLEITTEGMESKLGVDFAELYRKSSVYEQLKALVDESSIPPPSVEDLSFPTRYSQNYWNQFTCCLWKQHWTYWRSPGYVLCRIILCFASSIFFGTAFWGLGKNVHTQSVFFSLMGAIYTSQVFYGILTSAAAAPAVTMSRTIFYRERSAGMYNEIPYALAWNLIELPYLLITTVIYGVISYSMIQLIWDADKFFWYLYFLFCSQYSAIIFGMVLVILTPSPSAAAILSSFYFNLWVIFSGFQLPHNKFPVWWRWAFWLQPPSYHIYGTLVSQFGDLNDQYVTSREGQVETIPQLLRTQYGYGHSELGFIAIISFMWPFVMAVLFILGLKYLNYQQR